MPIFSKKAAPVVSSPPASAPDWAIHESQTLLYGAQKKAQNILAQAELEGIKMASESGAGIKQYEAEYNQQLASQIKVAEGNFEASLKQLTAQYAQFTTQLQGQTQNTQAAVEELVKTHINEILLNLEQKLMDFLTQSQQKSSEAITLELKAAQDMIENYRTQQFKLIDDNIVAVLERTFSLVLQKKLTLEDQLDLVYDALEKAKAEKFFG